MPYSAEHKVRTRERIVDAARLLFNQHGFLAISIDDVMAEAGLTRGGFYNHFRNKEELLLASIEAYGQCNPTDRWENVTLDLDADAAQLAGQMVDAYLSEEHLTDIAGHCPLVALPADIARAGPDIKQAYRHLLDRMTAIFSAGSGDHSKGLALTAMCIGAMLIGRTVEDPAYGAKILAATRKAARQVL